MRVIYIIFLLLCAGDLHAQLQWANWNALPGGGITFKNDTGKNYFDVPPNLQPPDFTGGRSYSYSNPATGKMIFLTDGVHVWNNKYKAIAASDSLISCDDDYYKVQILPFTTDNSKFYLFHLYSPKGYVSAQQTPAPKGCPDKNLPGLYYSVLNMNITAGTGNFTIKNQLLLDDATDRLAIVKHANGKDAWLVAHPWIAPVYTSFHITDAGITDSIVSNIGPSYPSDWQDIAGSMAASPDGKRIAVGGYGSLAEIYDFDNATGVLNNYRTVNFPYETVSSVCFSPDNSKLYITTSDFKNCTDYLKLYQVDFNENEDEPSKTLFCVNKYNYGGALKLTKARDNRIWIKGTKATDTSGNYFDAIEFPNQPKNACMLHEDFFPIRNPVAFPDIPNDYIVQPKENAVNKMSFTNADTIYVCFGTQTLTADAGYENYKWSTGDTTQSVTVSEPGLYTVLAGKNGFADKYKKPQAYGFVYVKNIAPEIYNIEDTLYCPKQPHILVLPDALTNIKWFDNDTTHIKPVPDEGNYVFTGINGSGCRVWDSICVVIHDKPNVDFGPDTALCTDEILNLSLKNYIDTTNSKDIKYSTYLWQDGSTDNNYTITKAGTYRGEVSFSSCVVADTINVAYIPLPEIDFGPDTSFCTGYSLLLAADSISNVQYQWNTGSTNAAITVTKSGTYLLKAVNDKCIASDTIDVQVKPLPVIDLGSNKILCAGDSALLIPATDITYNYRWQNGDTTSAFKVTTGGKYSVQAELNGCYQSDTVYINSQQQPLITLNDTMFCYNQKIELDPHVNKYDKVIWQNQYQQQTLIIDKAGLYTVKASNNCGADEKTITAKQQLCKIYMPNGFTPNKDGLNDVFRVKYPEIVRIFHMIIYNRWGEKIFETSDAYKGWDGKVNGIEQPTGNYIYQLTYTDVEDNSQSLKGYVVLIR